MKINSFEILGFKTIYFSDESSFKRLAKQKSIGVGEL